MPRYETVSFWDELHLDEGEEVVAAELDSRRNAQAIALVRHPSSGENEEGSYECGHDLGAGSVCSREVDSPDDSCWQHEEDDE